MNGSRIEYGRFKNYSGTPQIFKKLSFVDGVQEGQSIYYEYDDNLGIYERLKGNFVKGYEEGFWTKIEAFEKTYSESEYAEMSNDPMYKNSLAAKYLIFYKHGEASTFPDSINTAYYYPSGKIYSVEKYKNGKLNGIAKGYFPDGKIFYEYFYKDGLATGKCFDYYHSGQIAYEVEYDENYKKLEGKSYYSNGQLKKRESWRTGNYEYEGYFENGSPDNKMREAAAEKVKIEQQNIRSLKIDSANNALNSGNLELAQSYYKEANVSTEFLNSVLKYWSDYQAKKITKEDFEKQYERERENFAGTDYGINSKMLEAQRNYIDGLINKEAEKENQQKKLLEAVDDKMGEYRNLYVQVKNTLLVDQNNNPLTKESYPLGEAIYKKSYLIIEDYMNEYKNETNFEVKIEKGWLAIEKIEKMIKIASTETKEIDKQLKKIENKEEIKSILGL